MSRNVDPLLLPWITVIQAAHPPPFVRRLFFAISLCRLAHADTSHAFKRMQSPCSNLQSIPSPCRIARRGKWESKVFFKTP